MSLRVNPENSLLRAAARHRSQPLEPKRSRWQALPIFAVMLVLVAFFALGYWLVDGYTECRLAGNPIGHCVRSVVS